MGTAFNDLAVISFKDGQAGVEQLALRDDDDVEPRRNLVPTKNLSNQAFSSISLDRVAQLLRRGDSEPTNRQLIGEHEHRAVAAVHARAFPINLLKFGAGLDPFMRPERSQCLSGTYRQPFTPLRAPPLQHQPPVLRAHPHQEPVGPGPPPAIWLKRAFTLHDCISVSNDPSMFSKRFEECQRVLSCVTVAVLSQELRSDSQQPIIKCVWSLTKLFHSCGKNCGNPPVVGVRRTQADVAVALPLVATYNSWK